MSDASRRTLFRDLLPGFLLLGVGTLFFRFSAADITWTNPWRDGSKWPHGDDFPWSLLYQLGPYPALLTALVAVLVLLAGLRLPAPARFRRQSLYVISVLALGPGIIANAILKDHWGRPRPRDVRELGGVFPYEPLLTIDPLSPGKSFPSGHATMGFFFFVLYFLLRRHRPRWAVAALAGTCAAGFLIGWARVVQGGHFPSDVLWAGGVVWLVAASLAHAMKIDVIPPVAADYQPVSWKKLCLAGLVLPAAIFALLLATPFNRTDTFAPSKPLADNYTLLLKIPVGNTTIAPGPGLQIQARSHGSGLPGAGLKPTWKESTDDDGSTSFELKQRVSSLQTELMQYLQVSAPPEQTRRIRLSQEKGTVKLVLPDKRAPGPPRRWEIELPEGDVLLIPSSLPVGIRHNDEILADATEPADMVKLTLGPDVKLRIEK